MNVFPIEPLRERHPNEPSKPVPAPVDSKVSGFVLERIRNSGGALLSTTLSPQLILGLLPIKEERRKRKKLRRLPLVRRAPIGLFPLEGDGGCVNALLQWVFFIPEFAEQFFFAPKSFSLFQEFVDQYQLDQQRDLPISSANNRAILEFLRGKVTEFSLLSLFSFIIQVLGRKETVCKNLEEGFKHGHPSDLFFSEPLGKKQFLNDRFYYDLDAFIERRPDGAHGSYIAYVKHQGSWYQCDEEKVTLLRSNALEKPLSYSALLHYKQVLIR